MNSLFLVSLLALTATAFGAQILGPVSGVINCGSAGELLEIRVEGCDASPCNLQPGNYYEIEVDFVASANSDRLNWRVLVTLGIGGAVIADVPINGNIVAGESYTLRHELPISDNLSGMTVRVKFEITDVRATRMEVCAMADASIA